MATDQPVPMRCVIRGCALDGSLEHVFPQALGGTKQSRFLYCGACNVRMGSQVDAPFVAGFEAVTNLLDVRRDRGEAPTLKVTTNDGKRILLGPGGIPAARGPSPTVIEERDGKKHITITVPVDQPELGLSSRFSGRQDRVDCGVAAAALAS